tara:strand:- start:234508 stop:235233 length:726 start_codon:yes stop_codon:yes gene_type:complete
VLQTTKKKLSFIIYDGNQAPRYYELSKGLLRFIVFVLPTLALISILITTAGFLYFKQIRHFAQMKEPRIISELKLEIEELKDQTRTLDSERENLLAKLGQGTAGQDSLESLLLFKPSPGRKDLTKSPSLKVESIDVTSQGQNINLDFRILNLTKDESRISGFIFVILRDGNNLVVWPRGSMPDQEMSIVFNKGELFSTSRFRPVKVTFPQPVSKDLLFHIVIFSRTGDLIFKQLIQKTVGN